MRSRQLLSALVLGIFVSGLAAGRALGQCEQRLLVASDGAPGDGFGLTSDLEGDVLVVGAPGKDVGGTSGGGATYVFEWNGTSWIETLEIVITEATHLFAELGEQVDVSGNRVFTGAPRLEFVGGPNEGLVYVYERDAAGWTKMATILGRDVGTDGAIGGALAAHGDRLVLGVPKNSHSGIPEAGSAYLLEWNGTSWVEIAILRTNDPDWYVRLGASVAFDGETIAVGTVDYSYSSLARAGAVYVFEEQGGVWTQVAKLTPNVPLAGREFGCAIEIDGPTIVVSAKLLADEYPPGAPVYVFERKTDGSWGPHEDFLLTFDSGENSIYPRSTSIDGDHLLIGTKTDSGYVGWGGSGQLFERTAGGWENIAEIELAEPSDSDLLGASVAIDGERAFLGAPGHDVQSGEGGGYMFAIVDNVRRYCEGDTCPCGNVTLNYGGCTNSYYWTNGALLTACGTTSVVSDDLVLSGSRMRPGQKALPFMGGGQTFAFFGDGLLCVGAGGKGIYRFGPPQDAVGGNLVFGPGIVARSQSFHGAGAIEPGETWNFQFWYRDASDSPCGGLFNTTNALAVTFVP